MVQRIFKDFDDESKHYYIAKDIAEHCDIAIDEIKELDGHFTIIGGEIIFEETHKTRISIDFLNEDNDKKYSWDFTNNYHLHHKDSIPKVLFFWINKWKEIVQDEWGDCIGFYF